MDHIKDGHMAHSMARSGTPDGRFESPERGSNNEGSGIEDAMMKGST